MEKTNWYKSVIIGFALDRVFVYSQYTYDLQQKIHRWKFVHNHIDRASFVTYFSSLIEEIPQDLFHNIVIVYPPVSLRDSLFRWPNHAKMLAKLVAQKLSHAQCLCPFRKSLWAKHQARKSVAERKNIGKSYQFLKKYEKNIAGKNILLVDDIVTTGYTAHTLGQLLKSYGASSVVGVFLASEKV